jgi:hypothetical protein
MPLFFALINVFNNPSDTFINQKEGEGEGGDN